ncbi:MAG TPA: hypothetical protein VJP89_16335 [Pyrinomonadaceae bacterium]|nr:hypothetical protein [Pyrinomonadaceae bacterium]
MVATAHSITSPVYNVPAKLFDRYRGRDVIVRSSSPRELVECLRDANLASVRFMQLSSTREDTSCLENFAPGTPLDIVLENPVQYQQLYSYSNLLDSHPVRITIPLVSGFSKAVKLAISLRYAVKLDVQQPDEDLLTELESVLDLYLHLSSVNQPIEFFHSVLLSFYRNEPVSLWEITETDPASVCYVGDDGRVADVDINTETRECHECEFRDRCHGYFKFPDRNYNCDGVKHVFRTLANAADEVRQDLESFRSMEARAHS